MRPHWLGLMVLLFARLAAAEATTTSPAERVPMRWLGVTVSASSHIIEVRIDSEPFDSYRNGGTRRTKRAPTGGDLSVVATLTPNPESIRNKVSTVRLDLGERITDDDLSIGTASIKAEHGEVRAIVEFRDSIPVRMVFEYERWADAERKLRTYHRRAEGDAFADAYEVQTVKQWSADGKLELEQTERDGRIVESTDYKPGGVVGARVTDGNGEQRAFNADGSVATETPVRDGRYHGTERIFDAGKLAATSEYVKGERHGPIHEYYPDGKVAVRGRYEHGQKHSEWIIYNPDGSENRRVTFRRGELIEGSYDFPNWE